MNRARSPAAAAPPIAGAAVLCGLLAGCTATGPLDEQERAGLEGSVYYLTGGDEHGASTAVQRVAVSSGATTAITDGAAPSFVYGLDPSGRTLAMTVADDLVLADPDGRAPRRVASSAELDWYPRFSPDGRSVVFESARSSFRDLYRLDVATGAVTRLTDNPEGNFDAAWSPDGRRLAFASSRAGQLDVWVMNADGSDPRRLTRHAGDSVKPQWSPSGRYIAFISARDGRDDLYIVTPDGAEVRKLSALAPKRGRPSEAPHVLRFTWHPTEDRIAYAARPPRGHGQVHVVEAPSGTSTRLSRPEHDDREPSWSPDGAYLAFATTREHGSEIYIMRADGSRRSRLTETDGHAWLPRWVRATPRRNS